MPDSNSQVAKRVEPQADLKVSAERWRMMLAAPELLDALERAILASGFYINGPTHPDVCEDEGDPRWVGLARAAIAKARGL